MGKTGKEIEKLISVRRNRASEIWTVYQREGEASLKRKKDDRKPEGHMVLSKEEQENIRTAVAEKTPEDFRIPGKLWTFGRTREYIQKQYRKITVGLQEALGHELPASGEACAKTER